MTTDTGERLEHAGPHPVNFLPQAQPTEPSILPKEEARTPVKPRILGALGRISDIGRRVLVKWQTRAETAEPQGKAQRLQRAAAALGGMAAVTTVSTLFSRTAQAYAMTRHGIDLGIDVAAHPLTEGPSGHLDSTDNHTYTQTANAELFDAKEPQVRTQGTHTNTLRTAEPWERDRECVWKWAEEDIATAAHRTGLSGADTRELVEDEALVNRISNTYISSNHSIRNAPNHWLRAGETYNTAAPQALAEHIIEERHSVVTPPADIDAPQPKTSDPNKPPSPTTPAQDPPHAPDKAQPQGETLPWYKDGWKLATLLGLTALVGVAIRQQQHEKDPFHQLHHGSNSSKHDVKKSDRLNDWMQQVRSRASRGKSVFQEHFLRLQESLLKRWSRKIKRQKRKQKNKPRHPGNQTTSGQPKK